MESIEIKCERDFETLYSTNTGREKEGMSWMLERVGVFFLYIYPQSLHCSSVLKREMKMMKRITKKLTGLDEEPMYAGYWGWYT